MDSSSIFNDLQAFQQAEYKRDGVILSRRQNATLVAMAGGLWGSQIPNVLQKWKGGSSTFFRGEVNLLRKGPFYKSGHM
jgi:hypothetical protein